MMMKELNKYYSFYEVYDGVDGVLSKLDKLQDEGKIDFEYDRIEEILTIDDLDLEDQEIDDVLKLFEDTGVVPYLEREDDFGPSFDSDFIDFDGDL